MRHGRLGVGVEELGGPPVELAGAQRAARGGGGRDAGLAEVVVDLFEDLFRVGSPRIGCAVTASMALPCSVASMVSCVPVSVIHVLTRMRIGPGGRCQASR